MADLVNAWITAKTQLQSSLNEQTKQKSDILAKISQTEAEMKDIYTQLEGLVSKINSHKSLQRYINYGWQDGGATLNIWDAKILRYTDEGHTGWAFVLEPFRLDWTQVDSPSYIQARLSEVDATNAGQIMKWEDRGSGKWPSYTHTEGKDSPRAEWHSREKVRNTLQGFVDDRKNALRAMLDLATQYQNKRSEYNGKKSYKETTLQAQLDIVDANISILKKVQDEINTELQNAYIIEQNYANEVARKDEYKTKLAERTNELLAIGNSLQTLQLQLQGIEKSIIDATAYEAEQREKGYSQNLWDSTKGITRDIWRPIPIDTEMPDVEGSFNKAKESEGAGINLLYFTPLLLLL